MYVVRKGAGMSDAYACREWAHGAGYAIPAEEVEPSRLVIDLLAYLGEQT